MWKRFIHEYLSFTRKERTGIFILLGIILLCTLLPFLYPYFIHHKQYDHSEFAKEITALKTRERDSSTGKYYKKFDQQRNSYRGSNYYQHSDHTNPAAEVFDFDPNTASANEWKRLGLRDKTIETIQKYLSKGGHFYKPEDISKIWGLRPDDIKRLIPYITIISKPANQPTRDTKTTYTSYKKPSIQNVEINSADSSAFIALPGIGSRLASRIINFREKLGGFYSVDQVKETYGLPDSTFIKIKPLLIINSTPVKQININSASLDELRAHPYIRYNLANAIVQYRKQHGSFSSVADIKKIMLVTEEVYNKLSSYLVVN